MTYIPYNEVKTTPRTGLIENKGYGEMLQRDQISAQADGLDGWTTQQVRDWENSDDAYEQSIANN